MPDTYFSGLVATAAFDAAGGTDYADASALNRRIEPTIGTNEGGGRKGVTLERKRF